LNRILNSVLAAPTALGLVAVVSNWASPPTITPSVAGFGGKLWKRTVQNPVQLAAPSMVEPTARPHVVPFTGSNSICDCQLGCSSEVKLNHQNT